MDDKTIFTKTAKGLGEAVGKTRQLPRDLREILREIDGTSSVQELAAVLGLQDAVLREALGKLAAEEYIHEFVPPVVADDDEFDFDFSTTRGPTDPLTEVTIGAFVRAREQQEEKAIAAPGEELSEKERIKASVAHIREEALQKYHHDLEERARREAEEKRRWEAEEAERKAAEERARREAEEKARKDAALQAQLAAAERARQQAEEEERRKAEEESRREAEEELKLVAERARRVKEEWARKEAEKLARREAKAQAKKEAKELARRQEKEQAEQSKQSAGRADSAQIDVETRTEQQTANLAERGHMNAIARVAGIGTAKVAALFGRATPEPQEFRKTAEAPVISIESGKPLDAASRKPFKWQRFAGVAALIALVAGTTIAFTTTYDDKAAQFAAQASAQFGQPVKIGKLRLAMLPQPHWRMEDVSIGSQGQIRVARVDAMTGFGSLFNDRTIYSSVLLTSPAINEEGLGWLLFGRAGTPKDSFRIEELSATGIQLVSQSIELPPMRARAAFYDGGSWKTIALDTEDKMFHADLQPQSGAIHVDMIADSFTPPIGAALKIDGFHATGSATRDELSIPKFSGKVLNGFIEGSASLKWGAPWKLEGAAKVNDIDTPALAPRLLEGGKLDGNGSFVMEAPTSGALLSGARLDGEVTIRNGVFVGVNVASVLRGISAGGRSPFVQLGAGITHDHGRTQIRNMHAEAGAVSTSGNLDVDAKGALSGHFAVDLKTPTRQTRAFVNLGGTLEAPHFHR